MHLKQHILGHYFGLSPFYIFGIFLMLGVDAGILSGSAEQDIVHREEFEELNEKFEALNSTFEELNSKVDLILTQLAKDGPFTDTFRGLQGATTVNQELGVQGVQELPESEGNSVEMLTGLEEPEHLNTTVEPAAVQNGSAVIYFATAGGGGIKVYTEATNQVETFVESVEDLEGVAWDPAEQKLYYCSTSAIYRAEMDGTAVRTVFNSTKYGNIYGLAVDWITGNVYGGGSGGDLFVCRPVTTGEMACETLLSDQGQINGIVVDPNSGTMYWTKKKESCIMKAEMDGTNVVEIVTGLTYPGGILIDTVNSQRRLFWVDLGTNKVQSSKLDGTDTQTVVELTGDPQPWGLAANNDRLFWGNFNSSSFQTSDKYGQNVETLYYGIHGINHLTAVTPNPVQTQVNHCEGQSCSGVCVLNTNSFRCLP